METVGSSCQQERLEAVLGYANVLQTTKSSKGDQKFDCAQLLAQRGVPQSTSTLNYRSSGLS